MRFSDFNHVHPLTLWNELTTVKADRSSGKRLYAETIFSYDPVAVSAFRSVADLELFVSD